MRKANTNDMFNILRLINDLNLKEDIFKAQHKNNDVEKVGFNIVFAILSKATSKKAQDSIYLTLSEPFEMPKEDIGKLELQKLVETFMYCFDLSDLINFIKRAITSK